MTKIYANLVIFDEGWTLDYTLHSLVNVVDGVIIIDGPFNNYPVEPPDRMQSNALTLKIITKWRSFYEGIGKLFSYSYNTLARYEQNEKRQMGYNTTPEGFAFVVDGDELVSTQGLQDLKLTYNDGSAVDCGWVQVLEARGSTVWRPRLFKVGKDLQSLPHRNGDITANGIKISNRQVDAFNGFRFSKGEEVNVKNLGERIPQIRITNLNHHFRDGTRFLKGKEYKNKQRVVDQPFW